MATVDRAVLERPADRVPTTRPTEVEVAMELLVDAADRAEVEAAASRIACTERTLRTRQSQGSPVRADRVAQAVPAAF
jgi:hypothetical protein